MEIVKKVERLLMDHSARHPVSALHELETHFCVHIDYQAISNPSAKNSTVHKCIMRATGGNCHAYTEVTTENKRDAKRIAACCIINGFLENGIVEMRTAESGNSQKGWFTTRIYNRLDIVISRRQKRLSAAKQNFISVGEIKGSDNSKPTPLPSPPPPTENEKTAAVGTQLNTNETYTNIPTRPCTPPAPTTKANAATQTIEESFPKCPTIALPTVQSLQSTQPREYTLPVQSGAAVIPEIGNMCAPYCNPPLVQPMPSYHPQTMACAPQVFACHCPQPYSVPINPIQVIFVNTDNNLQQPPVPVQETKAPDIPPETKEEVPRKMENTKDPAKDQVITDQASNSTNNVKNKEERQPTRKELFELLKRIENKVQELRRKKMAKGRKGNVVMDDTKEPHSEQAPENKPKNQRNQPSKTKGKGANQVDTKKTVPNVIQSRNTKNGQQSTERPANQPTANQQNQSTNANVKGTKKPRPDVIQSQKDESGKAEPNRNEKQPSIQAAAAPQKEAKDPKGSTMSASAVAETKKETASVICVKNVEDSQLEQSDEWPTIQESVNQQKQLKARTIPVSSPSQGSKRTGSKFNNYESDHCKCTLGEWPSIQASSKQQQMSKTRSIPLSPAESRRAKGARGHKLCNNEDDAYERMPGEWPSIQASVNQMKASKSKRVPKSPGNYGEGGGSGPNEFRNRNARAGVDNKDCANTNRMVGGSNNGDVTRTTTAPTTNNSFIGRGPLTFADVQVIVKSKKEKRVKFKKKKTRCPIEMSVSDDSATDNAILKSKCLYVGSTEECSSNSSS